MTIYFYKDRKKEFRWRIKRKGRIIAESGEGYSSKAKGVRTLKRMIKSFGNGDYRYDDPELNAD